MAELTNIIGGLPGVSLAEPTRTMAQPVAASSSAVGQIASTVAASSAVVIETPSSSAVELPSTSATPTVEPSA
ncbi:hypothetical protein BCR39DRAFT_591098, partial [Naematelia encephala]